jgi:hypothetical protein
VVNRSATFVFAIGDRYFGTLTAYVPGAQAAHYDFTSALPVQLLKLLAPSLLPLGDVPAWPPDLPLRTTPAAAAPKHEGES